MRREQSKPQGDSARKGSIYAKSEPKLTKCLRGVHPLAVQSQLEGPRACSPAEGPPPGAAGPWEGPVVTRCPFWPGSSFWLHGVHGHRVKNVVT